MQTSASTTLSRTAIAAAGLILLATCAPRTAPPPRFPHPERLRWVDEVDWEAATAEATELLSAYIQVPTVNPPGDERLGAEFLAAVLARDGIEAEVVDFAPGRSNLIARLPATGAATAKPLCLLSHIDVVPAEVERWSHEPFAGTVEDGVIWGRGALDMKSVGMVELLAMVWLKRLEVPLNRDVILLAVGDEEVDNQGVAFLAEHRWDELDCGHVLNEGGMGVQGALFDDLTTFAVSYAEKGSFWVRMVVSGEPGHGSTPLDDSAPIRLQAALEDLAKRKVKPTYQPETFELLAAVGDKVGGLTGAVLRSEGLTKALAGGKLMGHPLSQAMITNTINVTGFGGAEKPNVVPSEVWAQLDIRMLPGVTPDDMLAELQELTGHADHIRFETIGSSLAETSPLDDPVYEAITRNLRLAFPDAAVGPILMPGSTDSAVLRPLGAHAYGLGPFLSTQDALRGMHGDDEHLTVDSLGKGLRVMLSIVLDVAAR